MKEKSAPPASKKQLTFELALHELEEITQTLEQGKDSLESSIKLYERGVFLKDFCQQKLQEAEGKWQMLQKKPNGDVEAKELPSSPQKNIFDA